MDLTKPHKFVVALALLAWVPATLYHFIDLYRFIDDVGPHRDHRQLLQNGSEQFDVCGRAAAFHAESWSLQQKWAACPSIEEDAPILLLAGRETWGQTGNQLRSLLRALQYARDHRVHLGIMYDSWAMRVLLDFFMAEGNDGRGGDEEWRGHVERTLCVEILRGPEELQGRRVIQRSQKDLFMTTSRIPIEELVASQVQLLRTLFRNYNAGKGHDRRGNAARDMCSGINSLFSADGDGGGTEEGEEDRGSASYSVIHLRYFGGKGAQSLQKTAMHSGCDPVAALEMAPEYVKSLLAPLGMLEHPIVVITDGQNQGALERLREDPDVGPMIRTVPEEARWFGGDVTLALMANAFIGNPASTMSGFIARSRVALGRGNNFMHMAKNELGVWTEACDYRCLFRYPPKEIDRLVPSTGVHLPHFPQRNRLSAEQ